MAKYEVRGTTTLDVYVFVEAESEDEALEKVEEFNFTPEEYCNETVGVTFCEGDDEDGAVSDVCVCATGWIDFNDVEEV